MRALLLFLALTACAGVTAKQRLYETLGGYRAAVEGAADYTEGPTADPRVVSRIRGVVHSDTMETAYLYAKAYVACGAQSATKAIDYDCTLFDFSDLTARNIAITLRAGILKLRTKP